MDQSKVGKFIAECRKNKNLTQEELGSRLGVSGKSVSKWERGVSVPDISILESLSSELGISINELLKGEHLADSFKNNLNNGIMIDNVKYYINIFRKNAKMKILLLITLIVFIFSLVFTVNNYSRFHIYSLKSEDERLLIDGYLIFNPQEKIFVITGINYIDDSSGTNTEIKSKAVDVSLTINDEIIFIDTIYSDNETFKPISEILNNFSLNIIDRNGDNFRLMQSDGLDNIFLYLNYDDEYLGNNLLKFKISSFENFSNNKFFY